MKTNYNIYCDETCHLPYDHQSAMGLGAVWCERADASALSQAILALKAQHKALGELKWTKVSPARLPFYLALVDWFFSEPRAYYRGLAVQHKERLNHTMFNDDQADVFYYKMQFSLINRILSPDGCYAIYLDVKDTQSRKHVRKLRDVLCNNAYDFTGEMVQSAQNIHSHESALMQLCDFFTGALGYRHRDLKSSVAKNAVIHAIEQHLGRSLLTSSSVTERKFNVFVFTPQVVSGAKAT